MIAISKGPTALLTGVALFPSCLFLSDPSAAFPFNMLLIVPGLHTEVQQAKTDNIQIFKNTIRTRDRRKGDIVIIVNTRRGATKTVMGLVSKGHDRCGEYKRQE